MRVDAAYWFKQGFHITIEGSREELKQILDKTINRQTTREFEECDIIGLPIPLHLHLKIPKEKKE